jgi:hypothetical protein
MTQLSPRHINVTPNAGRTLFFKRSYIYTELNTFKTESSLDDFNVPRVLHMHISIKVSSITIIDMTCT